MWITPEAMGFDVDLDVLPSADDVWAIEEKASETVERVGIFERNVYSKYWNSTNRLQTWAQEVGLM